MNPVAAATDVLRRVQRPGSAAARLARALAAAGTAAAFVALVAQAFFGHAVLSYAPSEVLAQRAPVGPLLRVGGLVEPGSLVHGADGVNVQFMLTDHSASVVVRYRGVLPDHFAEGEGVVVQGQLLGSGQLQARELLTGNGLDDQLPEVADILERARQARALATTMR